MSVLHTKDIVARLLTRYKRLIDLVEEMGGKSLSDYDMETLDIERELIDQTLQRIADVNFKFN